MNENVMWQSHSDDNSTSNVHKSKPVGKVHESAADSSHRSDPVNKNKPSVTTTSPRQNIFQSKSATQQQDNDEKSCQRN